MDFPRLTPKQRLANAALIAVGVGGLWFGSAPRGYGAWQPITFVLGMACIAGGVAALVSKRRQLGLTILTFTGALVGAVVALAIVRANHPEFSLEKSLSAEDDRREKESVAWGMALGAAVPPLAVAAFSAIRTRSG
jgi:hypothetical protein